MLMKPEDFLQKPKICRGEIHLVNMKRRFYNLDNEVIKIPKLILNSLDFDEIRIFLSLFDN